METTSHRNALTAPLLDVRPRAQRQLDNLALYRFAMTIADHFGLPADAVIDELELLPDNMLEGAHSPELLTALAGVVAHSLGVERAAPFMATVH